MNQKKSFLTTLATLLCFVVFSQSGEICGNGIDDDNNGFVDCYDSDAECECGDFFVGQNIECADEVDVTTFAIREQWGSADESATSHATPAVGDLDGNGIPEVVSVNNFGGTGLFVLNGATGATIASANDLGFAPENAPVLARIDDNEQGDIIVSQNQGRRIAMYNVDVANGSLNKIWSSQASRNDAIGLPGVADFDENGTVEIYYRNEIMDGVTGNVIIPGTNADWETDFTHGSLAVDVLDDSECADCAGLELISGNEIWSINEAARTRTLVRDMDDLIHADIDPNLNYYPKYFPNWDDQWSSVSAADFNLDGHMDILLSGALGTSGRRFRGETTIFFWDVHNNRLLTYHDPSNNFVRGPGRINIGDVDGDGLPNANFVMNQKLYSLDTSFNIHWIHPIKEGSSGFTGCSLFDFDGDGAVEVVYRSEQSLLIIDGVGNGDNTTSKRREIACISRTQEEYPVIADVDGDGSSEICVACYTNNNTSFGPYSNTRYGQIRVYESDGEAWMPARGIWNQHGYYNVNINDDLSVPIEVQDHTKKFTDAGVCFYADGSPIPFENRPLNTFINQAPILNEEGCVEFVSPDIQFDGILSASNAACPEAEITVEFQITNQGDTDISGPLPVSYYAGDPTTSNSVLLDTEVTILENFDIDDTRILTQTISGIGGSFELFVVINDNGSTPPLASPLPTATIPECETDNNIQSTSVGFDVFNLTLANVSPNQKCDPTKPDNGSASVFYFGTTPGVSGNIWLENFEDVDLGETDDSGTTSWTSDPGSQGPFYYGVNSYSGSRMFEFTRTGGANDQGLVTWSSEAIDISDFTDVSASIDIFESGQQEGSGRWRDFVRVRYEIRDNANAVSSSGLFGNGEHFGNFTYERATIGGINDVTSEDSLLFVTVEVHNTSDAERHFIDNLLVLGTSNPEPAELTEPDGFTFDWYNPGDYTSVIYNGSTYPQMATGTYEVIGYFAATGCYSDTVTVEILETQPLVRAWVYEISPDTDCASPNGALGAFVYTQTQDGTFPATESNPPQDSLLTADGYEFVWTFADDGTDTPLATGEELSNIRAQGAGYTVTVTENLTGCIGSNTTPINPSSSLINPTGIDVDDSDRITSCGGTAVISASVGGNTIDYNFYWYNGPSIKPSVDFTGADYTVNAAGTYTVVVEDKVSGCQSDPVSGTVIENTVSPNPLVNVTANTSCLAVGNGRAEADGDGAGTFVGYSYQWFIGTNTLAANELPAALAGSQYGTEGQHVLTGLTPGPYRLIVTDDGTLCSDTVAFSIAENAVDPAFNFPGGFAAANVTENYTTCDPSSPNGSIDVGGFVDPVNDGSGSPIAYRYTLYEGNTTDTQIAQNTTGLFEGLLPNQYTMVAENVDTGCRTNELNFTIASEPDNPVITATPSANNFCVSGNGSIAVTSSVSGSEPASGYLYEIFEGAGFGSEIVMKSDISLIDGSAGHTFPDLTGGDYRIRVTNVNTGCTSFTDVVVQDEITIPEFTATSTVVDNTSCNVPNGFVAVDIEGGNTGYTFTWYNGGSATGTPRGETTDQINGLAAGDYTVVARNNTTNCETLALTLTLSDDPFIPEVVIVEVDPDTSCGIGNGSLRAYAENDPELATCTECVSNYSFQWQYNGFDVANGDDLGNNSSVNGANSSTITGLSGDLNNYSVVMTHNTLQCTGSETFILSTNEVTPTVSLVSTQPNTSCNGATSDGSIEVSAAPAGTYTFRYFYSDGTQVVNGGSVSNSNTANVTGLVDDTYKVVAVSAASSCASDTLSVVVDSNPILPDFSTAAVGGGTSNNTVCDAVIATGTFNGQITVTPNVGVVADYSYEWFDGAGTAPANATAYTVNDNVLSEAPGGTYTVIITAAANACDTTIQVTINDEVNSDFTSFDLQTDATATDNTNCNPGDENGTITLDVTALNAAPVSGSGDYTFNLYDGNSVKVATDQTDNTDPYQFTGLGAGNYTVEVVDNETGCTTLPLTLTVNDAPDRPDFTPAALGAGTSNNTVCDAVIATGTFNGQITVTPNVGVVADYSYEWFDGAGTAPANATAYTVNDNVLSEAPGGTYTVIITAAANACDTTIQVTINDEVNSDFTSFDLQTDATATDNTNCNPGDENGTITLDVTALNAAPVSGSGDYTFNLYDGNSVKVATDQTDNTDPYQFTGLGAGNYTVEVVDNETGCTTLPLTLTVNDAPDRPDFTPAALGAGTSNNTVCDAVIATGTFNGQITVTPNVGVVADYSYEWFDGAGTAPANATAYTVNDNVLSEAPGGTYTVIITAAANACDTTIQVTINDEVNSDFTSFDLQTDATATDNTNCNPGDENGTITLDVTALNAAPVSGSGDYTFNLYDGNSVKVATDQTDNTEPYQFTGLGAGNYTVEVVDNETGCTTLPLTLTVNDAPDRPDFTPAALGAGTSNNTVCDAVIATGTFNGQITVTPNVGVVADYSYEWFDGAGTAPANATAYTVNDNVLSEAPGGTYTVIITAAANACDTTIQVTINDEVNSDFTSFDLQTDATATDNTNCNPGDENGTITLDVTALNAAPVSGSGDYTFNLYDGNSVKVATDQTDNTDPYQFTGLGAGNYTVEVVDNETGCTTLPLTLTVNDAPDRPDFTPAALGAGTSNNTVCDAVIATGTFNGQITVTPNVGVVADYSYEWFDGAGTAPANATAYTVNDNVLSEAPGGTYTVIITAAANACDTTIQVTINDDFTDLPVVDDLTGSSTKTDLTVCEGNANWPNGSISASVAGGSGNYSYRWYFGNTTNSTRLISNGDDIASRKGTGSSNALVSGADTENIANLDPGFYTVQVVDSDRGCLSTSLTFEVEDDTESPDFGASVTQDNFACSSGTSTGIITVTQNSGSGTFNFEWFEGGSASGIADYTTQTVNNLDGGTYTVRVTNTATSCTYVESISVADIVPTLSIATGSTDQTNCDPNGTVTATPSIAFNPAGTPTGYTSDFEFDWYLGNTTTTALAEGVDPGNGSNPTNVTTASVSGLAAGNYTVVVRDNGSNCVTTQETITVVDGISANSPTFDISGDPADGAPRNIPSDCGEESGYIIALITPNGGATYTYEWYEGSDDYTGTTAATPISNGTATSQGASNPQIINTSATEIRLTQVTSGLYSLVATDQTTGCKYQEVYDLGFIGQQTTTTIAIQNVEECPDDGQASVGIEDNPSNGIGTFAGEDDIQNYDIYLFAGNGVPANIYSNPAFTYTVTNDDGSTDTYPVIRDGSTVAAGGQVSFGSLPPGTYTAIARQKSTFNALQCWSQSAIDEIEDRAFEPILGAIAIVDNTVCDETIAGNFDGSASVSAIKNADDDRQPGDFRFEWSGPNGFTATDDNVTTSTQTNLESGDYDVTISRLIPTLDITYTPTAGTIAEGEDIQFSNGAVGVIISSPVSSPVTVYLLSGPTPVGGTFEGQSSEATANVTAVAAGTDYVNGCSISETVTVEDNPIDESIFGDLSITNVLNCDPDNTGVITVQDVNVTSGDVNDYEFAFYPTQNDAENNTNELQGFSASPTYNAPSPAAGDYYVVAVNQNTGCTSNPFEATIGVETVEPELRISAFSSDTSCDPDVNEGNGSITWVIDNPDPNTDYTYQWYVGDNTSGTALTNTAPITGALGTLNDASAANYTATLSGIAAGTYTVEVIDMDPDNDNCEAVTTYTILEESLKPTLVVADNITSSDNLNCSPDNGFIQINSVKEGTNDVTALGNYTFSWFRNGVAFGGTITSVASGTNNRIEGLDGAIYSVEITNNLTQCVSTSNVEIEIEDSSVNPVVQLDAKTEDTQCNDGDDVGVGTLTVAISEPGQTIDLADYAVEWYRGSAVPATRTADASFIIDRTGATGGAQGSAALVGGDIQQLTGLEHGTYTVFIEKDPTAPNAGCDVTATFTIIENNPILTIDQSADVVKQDNQNCTGPNGFIEITNVREDGVDNSPTGYTFTWTNSGGGPVASTNGTTVADDDNRIENLDADTYTVVIANNTTGCTTTSQIDIDIDLVSENPVVQLSAKTEDTQCNDGDDVGVGTLTVAISEPGQTIDLTDYAVEWYRGSAVPATRTADASFIIDRTGATGGAQGSAALVGGDIQQLTGLEHGTYTVFIEKDPTAPNAGCDVTATFTIIENNPILTIDQSADVVKQDNQNCAGPNGFIEITNVREDGVDNSPTGYTFTWTNSGGGPVASTNGTTVADDDNRIENLDADTYTVVIANNTTGCTTTSQIDIDIDLVSENPVVQLSAKTEDTQCNDGDDVGVGTLTVAITEPGQTIDLADYAVEWYRGSAVPATRTADASFIIDRTGATGGAQGSAALVGGDIQQLTGLEHGTYTVFIEKDPTAPNAGCDVTATFTIIENNPILTIDQSADVVKQDNQNCTGPNGFIEITNVREDGVDNSPTGYTFTWTNSGGGPVASTNGTTVADDDNRIENLDADTYTVVIANNTTGCTTTSQIDIDIDLVSENPVVQLSAKTEDTQCNDGDDVGVGTLTVAITEPGQTIDLADYAVEWYRGSAVPATRTADASFIIDRTGATGGAQGSAALVGGDIQQLTGLEHGTYTVFIEKDPTAPNAGCDVTATFTIIENNPILTIDQSADVVKQDNQNCTGPNGFIEITNVREDGVDNSPTGYTFTWTNSGGGPVASTNGTTVADDDNRIENLDADTYTVVIANNTTGCTTTSQIDIDIDLVSENPVVQLSAKTEDTQCNDGDDVGVGTLTVAISEPGQTIDLADYAVEWYRGSAVPATRTVDASFIIDRTGATGGAQGSAALVGGDIQQLTGLEHGTYTVFIEKDPTAPNAGCDVTATFTIVNVPDTPVLNASAIQANASPDTLCTGNSGTIVIVDDNITASLDDYNIEVRQGSASGPVASNIAAGTGSPSITVSGLAAADYYILATNSTTGCAAATAVINIKDSVRNPQIALRSVTPNQDCGANQQIGGLEVLVDSQFDETSGFLTFQWEISGGGNVSATYPTVNDTQATLAGVPGGDYTVTVTNTNTGCSSNRTFNVPTEAENLFITDSEIDNVSFCVDNGSFAVLEVSLNGTRIDSLSMAASGDYSLAVYPAAGGLAVGTTATVPNNLTIEQLSAGNYYAEITKASSGCTSDQVFFSIVEEIALPNVIVTQLAADSTCSAGGTPNGTLRALADGNDESDPLYDFTWFSGAGAGRTALVEGVALPDGSIPTGVQTSTISGLSAGTYSVQVDQLESGCTVFAEFTLSSSPADVDILDVTTTAATQCDPSNGVITITSVSRNAVSDYDFEFYVQDPASGAAPVFTALAGSAPTFSEAVGGTTYYIVGTNTLLNCTTSAYEVQVGENLTFPTLVLESFDFQSNCDPGNPNGRLTVLADGNDHTVAGYSFAWFFGTDTTDVLDPSDYTGGANLAGSATNEVTGIGPGFYTVRVKAPSGCISTETFEMTENVPNPVTVNTSSSPNTNCLNPNGKAAVSVITRAPGRSVASYEYYWYRGTVEEVLLTATNGVPDTTAGVPIANATLVEDLESGSYVVYVVDKTDRFCASTITQVSVDDGTRRPEFTLTTSDVTVCFDDKDGFASVSMPNLSLVDIAWYDEFDTPLGTTFFVDSLDAGRYRMELTHIITGCVATEFFDINNNAITPNEPTIVINNGRTNCQVPNGSAIANVDGETNNYLFEWFDPENVSTPYATGSEVFNLDSITYLVRATNITTGCESAFTAVEIRYEVTDPVYEVEFNNSICLRTEDGATNQFTGSATIRFDQFNLATDYEWRDGDGNLVGIEDRLIDAYPGDYTVTFVADNGCTYGASFQIETDMTIYNGVSANGDGKNDFFLVDCIDFFPANRVQIFNRAGQKVYDVEGYNNTTIRFEGVSNTGGGGLELPSGTYFFVIDLGNGEESEQGYLELVR